MAKRATSAKRVDRKASTRASKGRLKPRYTSALTDLEAASHDCELAIDGELIALANLNKVLWPADAEATLPAYTRRDHLRYLLRAGHRARADRGVELLGTLLL